MSCGRRLEFDGVPLTRAGFHTRLHPRLRVPAVYLAHAILAIVAD